MSHRKDPSNKIPVIAFSAWSGTGKTTVIEKLIGCLKAKGLRIAVIKHDAHDFEIDKEGKDSWRFTQAGADVTVLASSARAVFMEQRPCSLEEIISRIRDVDLIIAEGYNQEHLPRIGISRKETGKGFRLPLDAFIAVVTDELQANADCCKDPAVTIPQVSGVINAGLPIFALDEIEELAEFILRYSHLEA